MKKYGDGTIVLDLSIQNLLCIVIQNNLGIMLINIFCEKQMQWTDWDLVDGYITNIIVQQ